MRRKEADYRIVDLKALDADSGEGTFEAIVSVFGNVDVVGDRVVAGAFQKSLAEWKESGDPIPVIFDHQWGNLDALAGEVVEAEELAPGDARLPEAIKSLGGLWVKGALDIEDDFARKLWNKMRRRRLKEFSFAYEVVEEKANDGANELLELKIIEVGPTLKGANPQTQLVGVKSEQEAAALVADMTQIKGAIDTLTDRLVALENAPPANVEGEAVDIPLTPLSVRMQVALLDAV